MEIDNQLGYAVIGAYFVFLIIIGVVFKRLNQDENDYFRAGSRGTWWMVGMSLFMSSISTQTFIANAGVAYRSGFSIHWIYVVNFFCYMVLALGLAAWYRQARVTTFAEIVRERFGASFQQFFTYYSVVWLIIAGGLGLYMLSRFTQAIFGFPLEATIVVLTLIVLAYTLAGGNWAVLAADFLQSLLLFGMAILLAVLCLREVGGIGGFFSAIEAAGLTDEFRMVTPGREDGLYGFEWLIGVTFAQVFGILGMMGGHRFFSCKTGNEARKAALFCGIVSVIGVTAYFVPPMVARLLHAEEVMAMGGVSPQDVSYAFMSMKLLPAGLVPLMAVAMFSAQMSTMDTALNANSAIFVKNGYPALMRLFGREPSQDHRFLLGLGRVVTLLIGVCLLSTSLYFSRQAGEAGIFELAFRMGSLFMVPMMLPLFLGILVRNTPYWSGWVCFIGAFGTALICQFFDLPTHRMVMVNTGVGTIVFLLTTIGWDRYPAAKKEELKGFFKQLHTPIDFERETGQANDAGQMRLVGALALALAGFVALFLFLPNTPMERLQITSVAFGIGLVGALLSWAGHKAGKTQQKPTNLPH